MSEAAELSADLEASMEDGFIHLGPYSGLNLRVPGALSVSLGFSDPHLGIVYHEAVVHSFHGWDLVPRSWMRYETPGPELLARIGDVRRLPETGDHFHGKRSLVAEAIFNAMTRATESRTEQDVYGRTLVQQRRSSPHGRLICERSTYEGSESSYVCSLSEVESKTVANFTGRAHFCPSP